MTSRNPIASLVGALASGDVEIVDLTQPLSEHTPVIQLPEQFEQTPGLKVHEISRYDERGPAWAWNWLEIGEHIGTHFDAPVHWITGREGLDVAQVPPRHLVAPAVVIDRATESAKDPDYLLTVEDVRVFEDEHGPLPDGGWLLLHTGSRRGALPKRRLGPSAVARLRHRLRALDRRGVAVRRGRGGDRWHRRGCGQRLRPAVPSPLSPSRGGQVRHHAACQPCYAAGDRYAACCVTAEAYRWDRQPGAGARARAA